MANLTLESLGEQLQERFGTSLENYRPAPYLVDNLLGTDLVTVSGPAGSGKNYLISKTETPEVIKEATRKLRKGEIAGKTYNSRWGDLEAVSTELSEGTWVQVKFGPNQRDIYGSKFENYPSGSAIMDVMAKQALDFQSDHESGRLRFGSLRGLYVVTRNFHTIETRLSGRPDIDGKPMGQDEKKKRFKEAYASLEIGLQNPWFECLVNEDDGSTALTALSSVIKQHERDSRLDRDARNAMYAVRLEIAKLLGLPTEISMYSQQRQSQSV